MDNDEGIKILMQINDSLAAKLDVLRTAFVSLVSLYDEQVRHQLVEKFDRDLQQRLDMGLATTHPEAYFEGLDRHANRLKELLLGLKEGPQ